MCVYMGGGDLDALGVLGTLGDLGALVDLCDLGYLSQIIRGGVLVHLRSSRLPGGEARIHGNTT